MRLDLPLRKQLPSQGPKSLHNRVMIQPRREMVPAHIKFLAAGRVRQDAVRHDVHCRNFRSC